MVMKSYLGPTCAGQIACTWTSARVCRRTLGLAVRAAASYAVRVVLRAQSLVSPSSFGRRGFVRSCCAVLFASLTLPACESEASDSTPERVVAELIERMQRVHGDQHAARLAYELLWADARRNL